MLVPCLALAVLLLSTVKPKIINKEKTMVLVVLFFSHESFETVSAIFTLAYQLTCQ